MSADRLPAGEVTPEPFSPEFAGPGQKFLNWCREEGLALSFYWFLLTLPIRFLIVNHDRMWKNFFAGLPAAAVVVTSLVVFHRHATSSLERLTEYRIQTWQAIREKDYRRAEVLIHRILNLSPADLDDARLSLALIYLDTGREAHADLILRTLAPSTRRGYPPAHQYMAIRLAERLTSESTDTDRAVILHHLNAAPHQENPEVQLAWGRYQMACGNLLAARDHLQKAVHDFPEAWSALAEVQFSTGDRSGSRRSFERARDFWKLELQKRPADRTTREEFASVLIWLGEFDEARQVLEQGLIEDPDGRWIRLLAGLNVSIHDFLVLSGKNDPGVLLQPLSAALGYDENFEPALKRLMSYVSSSATTNRELRRILSRIIAEGKSPALAHLALGNLCWVERDNSTAVFHLERALTIDPDMAVVLNNLAWLIAHDEHEPDPWRGLQLVSAALQRNPEHPRLLDTRASIYMLLQKWQEALTDLELAVRHSDDPAPLHVKLAEVYENIGIRDIAIEHRRIAAESQSERTVIR